MIKRYHKFQIPTYIRITILLILSECLTSCQKAPINGYLDGQWEVIDVTPEPICKPIDERLYYCFSLHVCQLTYYDGIFTNGNIIFKDNTLYLDFPFATTPSRVIKLKQYGINENPVTFTVEHLDRKKLVLRNDDTVVTLRKF